MADQPNIIVFFTDQQRWDSTGLHGNPLDLTPNLDAYARENTHLRRHFTCQPVCGPARACFQTGTYASRNGSVRNGIALDNELPNLAGGMKQAGYETAYIGKWHLAPPDSPHGPVAPEHRGNYDYWLGANALEHVSMPYDCNLWDNDQEKVTLPGYRVDAMTDAAIRYIDQARDKPYFMFMSFLEPHHQNDVDDYPPPRYYRDRYTGRWTPPDLDALPAYDPKRYPNGGSTHQHLAGYWGMIKRLDEAFGRLLDVLESRGELDNTIVLFTSDHACHFRTRNAEYKRSCHDSSIRVPGVIGGPGFQGGGQVQQLTSLVDLAPTLLDAAGADVPETMQGRSILRLLNGSHADWPEEVLVQISESNAGRAVRTRRWKYCVMTDETQETRSDRHHASYNETFLYDLKHDPHELNNLIGIESLSHVTQTMRQRLISRMTEAGEPEPQIVPAQPRHSGQYAYLPQDADQ